ncbi:ABC transporter substrate-binding protein [Methylophilus aquaticus]|uniref:Extracellular solute-binding protein n=1 Tax=Methylophilus aquaticus TaxID=1971610 RepID=A0ABT9JQB8_9PROT|nr:extracellular solute-binding protein [Methylophilus aquaticus]MDP8566321.1 extracellular solute-binding protein [Methylophilus aquaticus]
MTQSYDLVSRFKKLLLASGLLLGSLVATASEKLVVMTSYPQEMISQFEAAFEQQFPHYRLEVLWKQSNDALSYLHQHPGEVDVYWTPSRQNFGLLAKQGLLQTLDPAWIHAPTSLHGTLLNDPQGLYAATEIAGLGMVIAPSAFEKAKLRKPQDWQDLANPALQGQIAFPLPSKVGFATGLIDAMLRGQAWADGWAMLTKVTLNARFIESGSTFITDEVASGRAMVGLTMDFFAASAIAKGAQLQYRYPPIVAYSPAHVAILQQAPHQAAAEAFAQFTLSSAGQQLLFTPDIRKLPVDPAVYAQRPAGYFDPYAAAMPKDDVVRDVIAQNILNTYFEASLVKHQALLQSLFVNITFARHLKRDAGKISEIEQQLLQPWLTEQALFSAEHVAAFQATQASEREALAKQWSELAKARYQAAANALQALLVGP